MPAELRARLTYANVVATLALFVALGGSSYAALKVTGRDVKNNSLTGRDVKKDSLTGRHVRSITTGDVTDGSLQASDFAAGQVSRPLTFTVRAAPIGNVADAADPGSTGPRAAVNCQGEEQVSGGGVVPLWREDVVAFSSPYVDPLGADQSGVPADGWTGAVNDADGDGTQGGTVYVICASESGESLPNL